MSDYHNQTIVNPEISTLIDVPIIHMGSPLPQDDDDDDMWETVSDSSEEVEEPDESDESDESAQHNERDLVHYMLVSMACPTDEDIESYNDLYKLERDGFDVMYKNIDDSIAYNLRDFHMLHNIDMLFDIIIMNENKIFWYLTECGADYHETRSIFSVWHPVNVSRKAELGEQTLEGLLNYLKVIRRHWPEDIVKVINNFKNSIDQPLPDYLQRYLVKHVLRGDSYANTTDTTITVNNWLCSHIHQ